MATLFDLTQQESGILVFDGSAVAAFNWSFLKDTEIPSFNPLLGAIGFPAAALDGDADELRETLPSSASPTSATCSPAPIMPSARMTTAC